MIERPIVIASSERLCRIAEVMNRTGLSRATIYRKMARNEFPQARQLGLNSVAWSESELLRWMQAPMEWRAVA